MGTALPHLQNEEEHREEDWDGDLQNQPRMCPQNFQQPQPHPSHNHSYGHKASSTPSHKATSNHLMFQKGILNKLDYKRNGKRK